MNVEQQQKTAQEVLGGGPVAAWITTTLVEWNVVLETTVMILGIVTGTLSAYFLIRRFIRERKKKREES